MRVGDCKTNCGEWFHHIRYQYADEAAGRCGDDQIQIFRLSTTAIAAAIDNEQLAGTVVRSEKPKGRTADNLFNAEFRSIRITAGPDELTKYLKEHGGTCFDGEA